MYLLQRHRTPVKKSLGFSTNFNLITIQDNKDVPMCYFGKMSTRHYCHNFAVYSLPVMV